MKDILSIDYKDWYINQKRIPDKESKEYEKFFDFHKRLCLEGCMMNGVYINPFLMWHINFWHTEVDIIDERGRINQKYATPYLRDNEWIITAEIERAHIEKKGLAIGGIRRLAKDLLNSSKLYTPSGEIEIGSSKVGEQIFDDKGKLTTITGVYPQGVRSVYKMTLIDGRELFCGLDHNWEVITKGSIKRKGKCKSKFKREVKTTRELLKDYKTNRIHNGYKDGITHNITETKYAIPNNLAVEYKEKELKINPYFLGLWLGDGTSRGTGITTMDQEIANFIFKYAEELNLKVRVEEKKTYNKAKTYIINGGMMGGHPKYNLLKQNLDFYNLRQNKHIPKDYLYSSQEQRMELLRGLMDSDGSCSKTGTITFVTGKEQLGKDFYFLCRSLGININKKHQQNKFVSNGEKKLGKPHIRYSLFTDKKIFNLQRKIDNIQINKKSFQAKINKSYIVDIQYVFDAETTCITVDNEQSLFLTDNFTVTHNSVLEASYIGWGATFDENSQNVISGLNSPDIKLITDKLDKGLNFVPEAWRWQRVEDNWKNQVTLGIKTRAGERIPFSQILIRNLDEGNNEEAIAGTKPRKLIIDEGGKGSFLRGLQAAAPGFTTAYGWGCSPIVTFTGGDMNRFMDAKSLMFDVDAFNFLSFKSEDDDKRFHGLFMSYKYRMEAKEPSTLGEYLNKPKENPLHKVPMLVSNAEKALEITDTNLERLKKAGDRIAYLKEKMYYPKKVDDIFLNESTNIFDIEAARRQQIRLSTQERTGTPVVLFHDGEKITHQFTDKLPITNFPLKQSDNKDAPIVIYEFPVESPPYGLYCAGIDPYRQGQAKYSNSLGVVYIYKRMHNFMGDKYQDMIVASYAARPDKKETWEEQARFLIKYYNARALCENDEMSFIEYMIAKGDSYYLERQPQWIKEIIPNTRVDREFGISRSATKVINYLHTTYKKYTEEVVYSEKDENGSIIREVTGMHKILDPLLLEETIQYNEDDNFDRIVAAEIVIIQALKMDPIMGKIGNIDARIESLYKKKHKNVLFSESRGLFKNNNKRNKIFM